MSLARVQKQLIRDLKRSPVKAGALGLLCLVALYFWAPLVTGWLGKKSPKTAQALPQEVLPAIPAAATSPAAVASVPWQQVVEWIESDRRMHSAQLETLASNPFGSQQANVPEAQQSGSKATAVAKVSERDLSELGLKLSSTMLGPRRRVAVINGRPYAEGGELEVGDDMVFLVARVTERSVLLERDGQRFELVIER